MFLELVGSSDVCYLRAPNPEDTKKLALLGAHFQFTGEMENATTPEGVRARAGLQKRSSILGSSRTATVHEWSVRPEPSSIRNDVVDSSDHGGRTKNPTNITGIRG